MGASGDLYTSAETPCTTPAEYRRQRVLEILPGVMVWAMLLLPGVLFLVSPWVAGYVLSAYVAYWVLRFVEMTVRQLVELRTLGRDRKADWHSRLKSLSAAQRVPGASAGPLPEEVCHLVILATYNEDVSILEESLDAIVAADYPKERVFVCLTTEERSRVWTEELVEGLRERYRGKLGLFLTTQHPDGIAGEGRVKGANLTWAARHARKELHRLGIEDERVIVSAFDADTRAGRDYFNVLAYRHLTNPNRDLDSYQPVLMYHNNIWDVPTVSRLVAFCSTFWTMVESTRPERMRIFSSHAMGMPALVASEYWSTAVIPDDSRQYWRMFFASNGKSRTVPLHTPVYMDAVLAKDHLATLKEQYLQLLRWAYGVIDFPYIMGQNLTNRKIPLHVKAIQTFRQFSQFNSWATAPFVLLMAPQILKRVAPEVQTSEFVYAMTILGSKLVYILPLGLVVSVVTALVILPPRPAHHSPWMRVRLAAEWVLLPAVLLAFICWPAIDAQTRLVFGRYIGFRVTIKNRHSLAHEVR